MVSPLVSFVVPCYKLAHYLPECVGTIVAQTYPDLEIIVLDDQSPDDAEAVSQRLVAAHPQRRIRYVRNPVNLGNIRTYNTGIRLAAGRYVWILSPDDRLRSPDLVQKYVALIESRPDVAYAFCPGHRIEQDADLGVHHASVYGGPDRVLDGRQVAKEIVDSRFELLAPAVMMRKSCYEEITFFPEDMPHRGDSYVWALIAMRHNVAYFAEPMVDYRIHPQSMMSTIARESPRVMVEDEISVIWAIKAAAERLGLRGIAAHCARGIIRPYSRALAGIRVRGQTVGLPLSELEASLRRFVIDDDERARVRSRVLCAYGDRLYWSGRSAEAVAAYESAGRASGGIPIAMRLHARLKLGLARSGWMGSILRHVLGRARRVVDSAGRA
jgi:glycosyltransferase involved in cell wall biosynthesis